MSSTGYRGEMGVKDLTRFNFVLAAYRRGLPVQEIAAQTGMSVVRVSQILRDALQPGRRPAGVDDREQGDVGSRPEVRASD